MKMSISQAFRTILGDLPRVVVVHSSLARLMPPPEFKKWDLLSVFDDYVKTGWTFAFPAFTFSFCGGRPFDIVKSPSETGVLADWVLECFPEAVRTPHPIDSTLQSGSLTYGELVIPGELESEVFLSTYVCHPSMANNELSGPAVATALAQWAMERPRKYTYRFVFIPEPIGSITYCSMNLEKLKSHVVAGFNLTCMGDERTFSYLPTRKGNTWVDRVALHVLQHFAPGFKRYTFLDRGSDERQYNAPGVDLPVCSVMRSKYGDYPEYHTSLDDLSLVTEAGLQSSFEMLKKCLTALELDRVLVNSVLCEPQMGRHNLYPTLSTKENRSTEVKDMMNMLAYIDGEASLLDIAETIGRDIFTCANLAGKLLAAGLCNND